MFRMPLWDLTDNNEREVTGVEPHSCAAAAATCVACVFLICMKMCQFVSSEVDLLLWSLTSQ